MGDLNLRLGGILAATVTPFDEHGEVDVEAYGRYIGWLAGQGVSAVVVHADSGEGHALTPQERSTITRTSVEAAQGRVKVVAGLIAQSTREAAALAAADRDAGADALMVFSPTSFLGQPLPAEAPVRYHKAIADASGLPLVAFQLQPSLGGAQYSMEVLDSVLDVDNVVALKESTFDAVSFRTTLDHVRQTHPAISFLSGNDNFIHESMLMGADGMLIGFGTVASRDQVEMFDAVQARDYERAAAIARRLDPLVRAVFVPPIRDYRARLKHVLTLQGVLNGSAVRPPLLDLDDDAKEQVRQGLEAAGLLRSMV